MEVVYKRKLVRVNVTPTLDHEKVSRAVTLTILTREAGRVLVLERMAAFLRWPRAVTRWQSYTPAYEVKSVR